MNEFVKVLLSLSVSGTLLLLFILGLKQIYRNKFSRRWQYYIWIIVVLRFLLPFTPDTMNVRKLLEMFQTTVAVNDNIVIQNTSVTVNKHDNELKQTNVPENEMKTATTTAQKSFDGSACVFLVWSVTALLLFVRKITIYQGFTRYIKAGNTQVSEIKYLNLLSDCEQKWGMKTRVELCCNAFITSPIMIGFFHPCIVLPAKDSGRESEDKELTCIFMHELCHYKQRDMFYKWLIQIVICIHWFNPFVYLLEKEVNKACELSCDEAVISLFDVYARRTYGDTLISFLKDDHFSKDSFTSVTLAEGAQQLKERLGAIMNYRRKSKANQFLTGILTAGIIFMSAFVGVYPVAAADSNTTEASALSTVKEGTHRTGTYVYNDTLASGRYLDDEQNKDKRDEAFAEMYGHLGIEKIGKSIYYQGGEIYVFVDERAKNSFYLEVNPKGFVSIQIVRDEEGKITGVSYMTEEEVTALVGGQVQIPVINTIEWDSSAFLTIEAYYNTDCVYIYPSATDKVVLKEYLTEDNANYYATAEIKNDVLTIQGGSRPTTNYKSYIELYVPDAVLQNIKVETVSGAITMESFTGTISLSSTSGMISVYDSEIAGTVSTISGEVCLSPSNIQGDLYVISHSGRILVYPPTTISYYLNAQTDTGNILFSHLQRTPGNKKVLSEIIGNNPRCTMTLNTVSGNIQIQDSGM